MPLPSGISGLGYVDEPFSTILKKFNVWRLPEYENAPEPFIGHIFMSRPSLEISNNMDALTKLSAMHGVITDEYGKKLALSLDRLEPNKWIPLITSRAKNYAVDDIELRSVEKSNTFFGHTITYSKHNEEYKAGKTISIDFRNDKYRSIFNLMYIWMFYIHYISRSYSAIKVFEEHEEKGILDYCASIYYIVTKSDNRKIIYWDKLTGVRPKRLPVSMYNWEDTIKVVDTISIEFEYGIRSNPMDPAILLDINMLNNYTEEQASNILLYGDYAADGFIRPDRDGVGGIGTPRFASAPVIVASSNANGIDYYLEFI